MKVATDEDARDCRNNDEERDERGGGERHPDDVALWVLDEGEGERLPAHRIFRVGSTAVGIHDADGEGSVGRGGGVGDLGDVAARQLSDLCCFVVI